LRQFDFRIIRSENHSFAEQVRIASRARYLVSNHGAGLTNILFMSPDTNVLELRHVTDRVNNCYFTLASALNLNYFYQSCEPADRDEDPHTGDLKVDSRALRANIELMLKS
jgi:capsular polysaccharide biosynthesis protein